MNHSSKSNERRSGAIWVEAACGSLLIVIWQIIQPNGSNKISARRYRCTYHSFTVTTAVNSPACAPVLGLTPYEGMKNEIQKRYSFVAAE